jgi:hypothetical protein
VLRDYANAAPPRNGPFRISFRLAEIDPLTLRTGEDEPSAIRTLST